MIYTHAVGIDPSTKTGIVVLDKDGRDIFRKEIQLERGIKSTAKEMKEYGREIVSFVPPGSVVSIEGFSYGSQGQGVSTQYGVGYAIRYELLSAGLSFWEPTPSQVKKFATGKGNTTKDNMTIPILRLWNFEHPSDNVRDAYVLAQIARGLSGAADIHDGDYYSYQLEVLQAMKNPPVEKKKKTR
ncbi:hypothetical protein VE23_25070 [Paenibacillus sp. D9]|uniref:hypothetical protein n=1 Tax=Paenibacillus sp. D9 TaxID=665792 RepID=UPI00061F449B|nr:hypothetical protein [Paenibacillus sp. D9]KKC49567.1 hypothetical protein VE23_25070 [Paenibacillus sp. D9]